MCAAFERCGSRRNRATVDCALLRGGGAGTAVELYSRAISAWNLDGLPYE